MTLVGVSKTVGADRLAAAATAGITILGENRVQEAGLKAPLLPGVTWHLIGPLQSNKARRAVEIFDVIQSVDSVELAHRLDRLCGEVDRPERLGVYLQVNIDRDASKAGFLPQDLEAGLGEIAALSSLRILGLMTVGNLVGSAGEARPTFARLRELSGLLRSRFELLGPGLSMGMSGDYEVAVEEGATVVRVGRALFGDRRGPVAGA